MSRRPPTDPATKLFKKVYFDLIGNEPQGFEGFKRIGHIMCEATAWQCLYLSSNKGQSELKAIFKQFIFYAERQFGSIVRAVRLDQEKGIGRDIENWLTKMGLEMEWSSVYTPAQNGRAERSGSALMVRARALRIGANLSEDIWPECYLAANYLGNRILSKPD